MTVWFGDPFPHETESIPHSRLFKSLFLPQNCGAEWFYYQWWLAPPSVRDEMADYWVDHAPWWDWRGRCQLRNVQTVEEILKRPAVFGEGWTKPKATLVRFPEGG
jgi:hypothetical protein